MFEIYSFCRAVDDIAGRRRPPCRRRDGLAAGARDLDALYAGGNPLQLRASREAVTRYGLRKDDFLAVIDGMEMDAAADIRAPDLATLDLYCDRVASAVGRLSVKVFGMDDGRGLALWRIIWAARCS